MNKKEIAVAFAESIAKDDSHGYDQNDRYGKYGDYDCSGLVITACETAGIPVKENGATYTGNAYSSFKKAGFEDVTKQVDLKTGKGMERADVLLYPGKHMAFYCGNGKMVDARVNENGKATGGKKGDQTGHEIEIHAYKNHPFKYVLRFKEEAPVVTSHADDVHKIAKEVIRGGLGNGAYRRQKIRMAGFDYNEVMAEVNRMYRERDFS